MEHTYLDDDGELPKGFDPDGFLAWCLSFDDWLAEAQAARQDAHQWAVACEVDRIQSEYTDWKMR